MTAPPLVIFDCDGLLVGSGGIGQLVLLEMLAECGARQSFDEGVAHFMGSLLPA